MASSEKPASSPSSVSVTLTPVNFVDFFPHRTLVLDAENKSVDIGRYSNVDSRRQHAARDNSFFNSKVMSRKHASLVLSLDNQEVYIKDTGSMHGTWLNNMKLGQDNEAPLRHHDTLTFGSKVNRGEDSYEPIKVRVQLSWKFEQKSTVSEKTEKQSKKLVHHNVFYVPDDDDVFLVDDIRPAVDSASPPSQNEERKDEDNDAEDEAEKQPRAESPASEYSSDAGPQIATPEESASSKSSSPVPPHINNEGKEKAKDVSPSITKPLTPIDSNKQKTKVSRSSFYDDDQFEAEIVEPFEYDSDFELNVLDLPKSDLCISDTQPFPGCKFTWPPSAVDKSDKSKRPAKETEKKKMNLPPLSNDPIPRPATPRHFNCLPETLNNPFMMARYATVAPVNIPITKPEHDEPKAKSGSMAGDASSVPEFIKQHRLDEDEKIRDRALFLQKITSSPSIPSRPPGDERRPPGKSTGSISDTLWRRVPKPFMERPEQHEFELNSSRAWWPVQDTDDDKARREEDAGQNRFGKKDLYSDGPFSVGPADGSVYRMESANKEHDQDRSDLGKGEALMDVSWSGLAPCKDASPSASVLGIEPEPELSRPESSKEDASKKSGHEPLPIFKYKSFSPVPPSTQPRLDKMGESEEERENENENDEHHDEIRFRIPPMPPTVVGDVNPAINQRKRKHMSSSPESPEECTGAYHSLEVPSMLVPLSHFEDRDSILGQLQDSEDSKEWKETKESEEVRAEEKSSKRKVVLAPTPPPEPASEFQQEIEKEQEQEQPPRKRVKMTKVAARANANARPSLARTATRYAATAFAGAVVGGIGVVAALAALPPDYFA